MKRLANLLKLDFTLLYRNRVILIAAVVTALYAAIFQVLPQNNFETVVTLLIFTDPVMLGFMFIGVTVLFEKSGNTLQALSVTPVRAAEYLGSKAISLTIIATLSGVIMAIAGMGVQFQLFYLVYAMIFSSFIFIFLGFVGVSRVKTFNQYFIYIPMFMIPGFLPFLNYFGITDTLLFYIFPTQASLILLDAALDANSNETVNQIIYSILYLPIFGWLSYLWARSSWHKTITH